MKEGLRLGTRFSFKEDVRLEEYARLEKSPICREFLFQASHELLEVLLSDDCTNALLDEEVALNFRDVMDKNIPADSLRILFSPIGIQAQKDSSFKYSAFKTGSPEVLERIMTPAYLKAMLLVLRQNPSALCQVPEGGKDTPYASHVLRDRWKVSFDSILTKTKEMEETAKTDSSYTEAAKVARTLCGKLKKAEETFLISDDPLKAQKEFVTQCLDAVKEARPELKKHRGYSFFAQILLDVVNALVSIATLFIPNMITGRLRLFEISTDSNTKLTALEKVAEQLKEDVDKLENTPFNLAAGA